MRRVTPGLSLLLFVAVAALMIAGLWVAARVLRVRSRRTEVLKAMTYECGEAPSGITWVRFHARYYVVALFFVLFDIEAAFLYPWAVLVKELGVRGLWGVFSFVGVLMVGWLWALKKGALQWQ